MAHKCTLKDGGCPLKVRTDWGTENGLVAAAQCFFIGNDLAHIYGTSPHNQRIEQWWSYLRQHLTSWWINFFKDLLEQQMRGTEDFLAPVSAQQCNFITENYLPLTESTNEYQEYFQYAFQAAGLSNPQNWREALDLYHNLHRCATSTVQFR